MKVKIGHNSREKLEIVIVCGPREYEAAVERDQFCNDLQMGVMKLMIL